MIDGTDSAQEVTEMIRWLPDTSPVAASIAGGVEWLGWGLDRALMRRLDLFTHAAVSSKAPRPIDMPKAGKKPGVVINGVAGLPGAVRRVKPEATGG